MTKQLNEFDKGRIKALLDQGYSYRKISAILNIPFPTIAYNAKKFKQFGNLDRLPGSGRQKILNIKEENLLAKISSQNPRKSAKDYFN